MGQSLVSDVFFYSVKSVKVYNPVHSLSVMIDLDPVHRLSVMIDLDSVTLLFSTKQWMRNSVKSLIQAGTSKASKQYTTEASVFSPKAKLQDIASGQSVPWTFPKLFYANHKIYTREKHCHSKIVSQANLEIYKHCDYFAMLINTFCQIKELGHTSKPKK